MGSAIPTRQQELGAAAEEMTGHGWSSSRFSHASGGVWIACSDCGSLRVDGGMRIESAAPMIIRTLLILIRMSGLARVVLTPHWKLLVGQGGDPASTQIPRWLMGRVIQHCGIRGKGDLVSWAANGYRGGCKGRKREGGGQSPPKCASKTLHP
jgi:hypothetical protein